MGVPRSSRWAPRLVEGRARRPDCLECLLRQSSSSAVLAAAAPGGDDGGRPGAGGGDLHAARALAGRDLVSRDTSLLDAGEVASAAIESVAENLTDSLVAPLLYYLVAGLPGAWAYRVINTADAMVGYRTGRLEYLGKVAARLDDVVNLLPARLAALALVMAARVAGADGRGARAVLSRDHARTASPNAGWTMSAMAGALGVTLAKRDAYRLGDGTSPDASDVARAVRVAGAASALIACAVRRSGVPRARGGLFPRCERNPFAIIRIDRRPRAAIAFSTAADGTRTRSRQH